MPDLEALYKALADAVEKYLNYLNDPAYSVRQGRLLNDAMKQALKDVRNAGG